MSLKNHDDLSYRTLQFKSSRLLTLDGFQKRSMEKNFAELFAQQECSKNVRLNVYQWIDYKV